MERANRPIAEAEARRLWSIYGLANPTDLNLEDLALAMGVVVVHGGLDGAEARLVRSSSKGIIRVRAGASNLGRQRFAIAHEIGHWVLHDGGSQVAVCTEQDLFLSYRGSREEQEASAFASVLLMPDDLIHHDTRRLRFTGSSVRTLATRYQTSLTAAAWRFVETARDYCALVVSRRGRVEWVRMSDDFRERLKVGFGSNVPGDSVAARVFRGGALPTEAEEVPFDSWSTEPDAELSGLDLLEDVIHLANFDTVLSLLSMP